jgi:N-acetylglutamate synthase-like GNAT family acetyltransferase
MKRDMADIRPATMADWADIKALVRSEALNPNDLDWRRFLVATYGAHIIGAVQMRRHADGARELGSLVVRTQARGHGIATRLIDALLVTQPGHVLMITGYAFAKHYAQWGFRRTEPSAVPASIRRNYRLGRLAGVISLLKGRKPKKLVILERHCD